MATQSLIGEGGVACTMHLSIPPTFVTYFSNLITNNLFLLQQLIFY
jgi:hypothetical protein